MAKIARYTIKETPLAASVGVSVASGTVTTGSVPAQVTGLAQTGATFSAVSASWAAASGADTYNVYVDSTTTPTLTGITDLVATVPGLSPSTGYSVYVAGINNAGVGPLSDPVTMTTSASSVYDLNTPLRAFIGAEGGGALAKGGRGGQVLFVTNLNDSGAGSLRAALTANGARYVIFRVAGTIVLQSPIRIWNGDLTVAGQTAPGGGIQITKEVVNDYWEVDNLSVWAPDVVMRYLRLRGHLTPSASHANQMASGAYAQNVIFDHCSLFWSNRNISGMYGNGNYPVNSAPKNCTYSNCILAESLNNDEYTGPIMAAATRDHADVMTDMDFHHNYVTAMNHRVPLVRAKSGRVTNNIFYNWAWWCSHFASGSSYDIRNNIYKAGPVFASGSPQWELGWIDGDVSSTHPYGTGGYYVDGNIGTWHALTPQDDQWEMFVRWRRENSFGGEAVSTSLRRASPLPDTPWPITVSAASGLRDELFPHVGASRRLDENGNWVGNRDSADTRVLDYYDTNTGQMVSNPANVGGRPTIAAATPYQDSNNDGVPDAWSVSAGISPSTTGSGLAYHSSGYQYIELFLSGVPGSEL
jgi:pectate lyase